MHFIGHFLGVSFELIYKNVNFYTPETDAWLETSVFLFRYELRRRNDALVVIDASVDWCI